ncbi:hypothetical protein GCM10027271_40640 [Saccharopolyspora gloriosae]
MIPLGIAPSRIARGAEWRSSFCAGSGSHTGRPESTPIRSKNSQFTPHAAASGGIRHRRPDVARASGRVTMRTRGVNIRIEHLRDSRPAARRETIAFVMGTVNPFPEHPVPPLGAHARE